MLVVIVYDISTAEAGGQKRLRKVARLCRDWGISVQDSVYECELDASQYRSLKENWEGLSNRIEIVFAFICLVTDFNAGSKPLAGSACSGIERHM